MHARRHVGRADRAEQDRVEPADRLEVGVGRAPRRRAGSARRRGRTATGVVARRRPRRRTFIASATTSGPMPSPPMIPIRWLTGVRVLESCVPDNEKPPMDRSGRSRANAGGGVRYEMTMTEARWCSRMNRHRTSQRQACRRDSTAETALRRVAIARASPPVPWPTHLGGCAMRRLWKWLVLGLVVVVGLAFAGLVLLPQDRPRAPGRDQGHAGRRPTSTVAGETGHAALDGTWTVKPGNTRQLRRLPGHREALRQHRPRARPPGAPTTSPAR